MDKKNRVLVWIPRVLAISFILFISIFAFDVFGGKEPLLTQLLAFLTHLIPSFILLAALLVAWKRPVAGGWVFIAAGIGLSLLWGAYRDLMRIFMLILPMAVTGVLFIVSGSRSKQ